MKSLASVLLALAILRLREGGHSFSFPVISSSRSNSNRIRAAGSGKRNGNVRTTPLFVANGEVTTFTGPTPREIEATNSAIDYSSMTTLPRHPSNEDANDILTQTEEALRSMQEKVLFLTNASGSVEGDNAATSIDEEVKSEIPVDIERELVYANSYVDLGKVDTVGFGY